MVRVEGVIIEALPGLLFRVVTDDKQKILAHPSGKMKLHRIKMVPGDRVIVELAGPGEERGRIVRRY